VTAFPHALRRHRADDPGARAAVRRRGRGQILIMFAMTIGLLFGLIGLVVDVGNWWNESLHVQLAAEAGALAGVPYMPGDFTTASAKAKSEATKNGFTTGTGTTVTTAIDPESDRRLDVTISKQFNTIFLGLLGMPKITITRQAVGEYTLPVPMGSPLSTYGDNSGFFWAAAEAQGTNRSAGDAFGTYYNPSPTLNSQYVQPGYQYAIDVPAGAGATNIQLYDPTFCAVDDQKGTGDHWIPWNQSGQPAVSTYYTLWTDPAATPLDYSDDVVVANSGTRFENERQVDKSAALRNTQATPYPGNAFWSLPDCASNIYHNAWWTFATVTTPGTYRLQVTTTNQSNVNDQKNTSAENMWALRATATDPTHPAYVYGLGKMVIYANVTAGTTLFYLSRIEAVHAGKTMVIQLFDPGDASGSSSIQILQPTSSGYSPATFSYTADSNATGSKLGTNVTSLATTIGGTAQYNNSWVTLTVSLPKTYTAPLPPGEPAGTAGGWWKIKYNFTSTTTDTTTWQVSIRGNPVHLVQP
jgi:Flp pilus assembly protein TadG